MIIMGLDPGLATMGFGVINLERGVYTVIDYGIVSTPKEDTLPVRLSKIEQGVTTLIETYKPSQISVEELFFSKNITTGISVAEARGVMLLTAVKLIGDEVYEYTPNQIKMAITGYGGADKNKCSLWCNRCCALNPCRARTMPPTRLRLRYVTDRSAQTKTISG